MIWGELLFAHDTKYSGHNVKDINKEFFNPFSVVLELLRVATHLTLR